MNRRRKSPVEVVTTEPQMCSHSLRLHILRTLPFFESLSQAELEQVNPSFHEKGFEPSEFLYQSGDPAAQLFVVAEGRVRLLRLTMSGKQVMLDLMIPGDFFGGLGQEQVYPDTAQAQTAVCALIIRVEEFRRVLQSYPAVALKVLDVMAGRLQAAHDSIHLLSAEPAEKRVAHLLLKLARKLGQAREEGLLIQTPLGRDELAEMTGITPETASRVISLFQKEGWIATGRQWIALQAPEALEEVIRDSIGPYLI